MTKLIKLRVNGLLAFDAGQTQRGGREGSMDRKKSAILHGRGTTPDGSKVERRKSYRFLVAVPVEASWRNPEGVPVLVQAVPKQDNAHGGFLGNNNHTPEGNRGTPTKFL